jgi:undecaprenyl-diphosphatase
MELLTTIDRTILFFFNSFAHRWWSVDAFVHFLASNDVLKGCFVVAVFWFVWFESNEGTTGAEVNEKRQILLYTILVCVPGLIVTRMLASCLPFRQRPLYNPGLHLHRAFTFDVNSLETWSSFPSDHAVLFFAIATGVFLVNRKVGVFIYLYTTLCIAMPRLFLGIHYPSDILAGGLFGSGLAYSAKWSPLRSLLTRPALRLQEVSTGLFYACFFFLTYQTADLYNTLRGGVRVALQILRAWSKFLH